jgi:hypothetical protein
MRYDSPAFDTFDSEIAVAMIRATAQSGGLPGFLNATLERYEPGKLIASMTISDEHLTPMGAIHGGEMAGFVDHVLGRVLYPLLKKGQWAATTEFKLNYSHRSGPGASKPSRRSFRSANVRPSCVSKSSMTDGCVAWRRAR